MKHDHRCDEGGARHSVEELVMNWHLTEACNYRSGGTTEQAAEDGASETTEQHAGRTSDCTDGCAGLGAGQRTTGTCCGTADGTDRAADPSGGVQAMDVG